MRRISCEYSPAWGVSRPTQIPDEAMEVIADVLLASAGKDEDHPAYNERQLERKRRRASCAEEHFALTSAGHTLRDESAGLTKQAGLTRDEQKAWEMYSAGYKISEISRLLRLTRASVRTLLRHAARRISTCESTLRGLDDVYYREVHKRIYRRPRHCPAQPCRRLGYCKFALGMSPENQEG